MPVPKHTAYDTLVDALSTVLVDPCRREVLSNLKKMDTNSATLDDLAGHVHENMEAVMSLQHARSILVQQHLPMLADHHLIEYDTRSQTIRYWGNTASDAVL